MGQPPLIVETNGGSFEVHQVAEVEGFGEVWFHPKSMTNIFSHVEMSNRFRITYDNHNKDDGDSFIVHHPIKPIRFARVTNNLYVHQPLQKNKVHQPDDSKKMLLNTQQENKNFCTAGWILDCGARS